MARNRSAMRPLTAKERDLVERHLKLVRHIAKRFLWRGLDPDELYSAGCLGLCVAAIRFDERAGVGFSTYGGRYVTGYMRHEIRARRSPTIDLARVKEPETRSGERGERYEAVRGAVERLPHLACVVLRHRLSGLSPKGVARKLHRSVEEVKRLEAVGRVRVGSDLRAFDLAI